MADPKDDEVASLRCVHDHLRFVREERTCLYSIHIEKVQKLVNVHLVLFAAFGYALSQLDWLRSASGAWQTALFVLGIISGLLLFFGFFCCVKLLQIDNVHVLGVEILGEELKKNGFASRLPSEILTAFSRNLQEAIQLDRQAELVRRNYARCLNGLVVSGFFFVALFVAMAVYMHHAKAVQ